MASRARRGVDPYLDWKIRIFFAAAALVAAGVLLRYDVLVLLAIGLLVAGLLVLTYLATRRRRAAEEAVAAYEGWEEGEVSGTRDA